MTDTLLIVIAAGSGLAALFSLLNLLGVGRGRAAAGDLSGAVRDEAERSRKEALEQARELREEVGGRIDRFQENLQIRLQSGIDGVRAPIEEIGKKLDADITRMGHEAVEGREALRHAVEAKLDASDRRSADAGRALREELTGNFGRSSEQLTATLKELGAQQTAKLGDLAQQLVALTDRQAQTAEALRLTVEGRLDALRTENAAKLDQMRETVDEKLQSTLEQRLGESFRTVSEQLKQVHQGLGEMQTLATGVGDLKKVLTNVKTRGTWGEVQLGMLLEQFLSPEQFIRNAQCREGSLERVEFAIRFTGREDDGDLLLPIDAKFPHEDYERLVHASELADAAAVEEAAKALEVRVKSFAKSVAEKYINPPMTTDFAVLFLPTESLFAEILRRPGFFESLQREYRVTIAGPTTLASMLNAFQMGFRSLAIQKRSSEVWQLLGAVRKEFEMHGAVVSKLKKQLNAASNTIDNLGTRTKMMNRKLRDVEVLSDGTTTDVLGLAAPDYGDSEDEVEEAAE
jgi:DNA recombination protein RmuC